MFKKSEQVSPFLRILTSSSLPLPFRKLQRERDKLCASDLGRNRPECLLQQQTPPSAGGGGLLPTAPVIPSSSSSGATALFNASSTLTVPSPSLETLCNSAVDEFLNGAGAASNVTDLATYMAGTVAGNCSQVAFNGT